MAVKKPERHSVKTGGNLTSNLLEETTFTFKPKVSAQSVKIAQSLGTNFTVRQEQHLEKQRKFVSLLTLSF